MAKQKHLSINPADSANALAALLTGTVAIPGKIYDHRFTIDHSSAKGRLYVS